MWEMANGTTKEPQLPIILRLNTLYTNQDAVGPKLMAFVNKHLPSCEGEKCGESLCSYFHWFMDHYRDCKKQEECSSCVKLKEWMGLHTGCCNLSPLCCPLDNLCKDMKELQLRDSFRKLHSDYPTSRVSPSGSNYPMQNGTCQNLFTGNPLDYHEDPYPSLTACVRDTNPLLPHNPSVENNDTDPLSFLRRTSMSSTASSHQREVAKSALTKLANTNNQYLRQNSTDLRQNSTDLQQREVIELILKQRQDSSASSRSFSQASFGDAAIHRLDSQLSMTSSQFTSPESSVHSTRQEPVSKNDSDSGSNSRALAPIRKRSSDHKLVKMPNFDLSQPENIAAVHKPIQRQTSEVQKRFVKGGRGSSITIITHSRPDSSDGDSSTHSGESDYNPPPDGYHDQVSYDREENVNVGFPIQKAPSVGNEDCTKLLLERGSITFSDYANIQKFREKNSLLHGEKSEQSNRNSYEMSEISTPSLSPNFSGSNSQYSSLGDSSGGDTEGGLKLKAPSTIVPPSVDPEYSLNPLQMNLENQFGTQSMSPDFPSNKTHSLASTIKDSSSFDSRSHDCTPMSHDCTPISHGFSSMDSENGIGCHDNVEHEKVQQNDSDDYEGSHSDGSYDGLDAHIFEKGTDQRSSGRTDSMGSYSSLETSSTSYSNEEARVLSPSPHHHQSIMTKEQIQELCATIDKLKEEHMDDIAIMNNRGKILPQAEPYRNPSETERKIGGTPIVWDKDADGCKMLQMEGPSPFPKQVMEYYQRMMRPIDEQKAAVEEVDHREHLKKYLMGQFCRKQVYREGVHWRRQTKLGRGGQATCYSIMDKSTSLSLALKEELENDKSLDEAYVCLKLARELNVSRNIAEYFGAAMLPNYKINTIQLFMEIMPTCMQAYLFKNGPLTMADVHHFSFQLFDALEYLHNKERIIHCDIKPANLLLDYTAQRMKLADFGAAELLEERKRPSDRIHGDVGAGTLAYNPPEHYSRCECSFALDSWQAGCCVLAMSTGRRPWRHLFMDPIPTECKQNFNKLKRCYGVNIGKEQKGHMVPTFLDTTISKLLFGSLHSDPKMRLTAMECRQLLAFSEEMNEEQRKTVSDAIGYPSTSPLVLQTFSSQSPHIDVFLGSFYEHTIINGHGHTLYPGWMGSVPYRDGMTYEDLSHLIFSPLFPVLKHLSPLDMATWESTPQELFITTNPHQSHSEGHLFLPVDRRLRVDPNKAIVLFSYL